MRIVKREKRKIHIEFWWGNLLEDRDGDGRITLGWMTGRWVVRIGDEWNWLRIVSNGGLQQGHTFVFCFRCD
jgi:hypothetical protein